MNQPSDPVKIAVALSGGGRTLENLLAKSQQDNCPYQIVAVISSNPKSRGIEIAEKAGLPIVLATGWESVVIGALKRGVADRRDVVDRDTRALAQRTKEILGTLDGAATADPDGDDGPVIGVEAD